MNRDTEALQPAGLLRRVPALLVDQIVPGLVLSALFLVDVFDRSIFVPPADWFWTEWLLRHWLDHPGALIRPVLSLPALALAWTAGWEAAVGRTPGDMLLGLTVVTLEGEQIGPGHAFLRAIGVIFDLASLGFGYLWIVVSPSRRGWHDLLSGTVVIRT